MKSTKFKSSDGLCLPERCDSEGLGFFHMRLCSYHMISFPFSYLLIFLKLNDVILKLLLIFFI